MMQDDCKFLMNLGFVIYEEKDKFFLQKIPVPHKPEKIDIKEFKTFEKAVNYAKSIYDVKNQNYQAIIRYSRGLGVEYLTIPNIIAEDEEKAKSIALEKSDLLSNPKVKIAEVKLRTQN